MFDRMISRFSGVLISGLAVAMVAWVGAAEVWAAAGDGWGEVGVAEVEITPESAVRLNGYGNRRKETGEVVQPIYAKALAFGADDDPGGPAVLVTADQCIVPAAVTQAIAERLEEEAGIP
ncbi:MAG: hypothetical protein WD079_01840, partial [Phycisphaeraceae bacterium]